MHTDKIHEIHNCPTYNLEKTTTNNNIFYWERDSEGGPHEDNMDMSN